jgi:hypothetical protein
VIHLSTAARLRDRGFELLPTGLRPHDSVRLRRADGAELGERWPRPGHRLSTFNTLGARSGERRAVMYCVDITADLNDEDETGYIWTFRGEARDPGQIKPGALVVAGAEDTAAVCQVAGLAPTGDGTIVHLRLLPGLVDDYRRLVERALAS